MVVQVVQGHTPFKNLLTRYKSASHESFSTEIFLIQCQCVILFFIFLGINLSLINGLLVSVLSLSNSVIS